MIADEIQKKKATLDALIAEKEAKMNKKKGSPEPEKEYPDEGEMSFEDFVQLEFPPIEYFWDGVFEKGSLNMICGDSGIGKSRLAHEIIYCIASGETFFNKKTQQAKVLILDGEHKDARLKERLQAVASRRPVETLNLKILSRSMVRKILGEPLNLYSSNHRKWLNKKIDRNEFILIDTYSSCAPIDKIGGYENEHTEWKKLEEWLLNWTEQQKTFLFLHHTNAEGGVRGTSLLKSNMSTIIYLHKHDGSIPYNALLHAKWSIGKGRDIPIEEQGNKKISFFKDRWSREAATNCGWVLQDDIST